MSTVVSEIFARIVFSRKALKDKLDDRVILPFSEGFISRNFAKSSRKFPNQVTVL